MENAPSQTPAPEQESQQQTQQPNQSDLRQVTAVQVERPRLFDEMSVAGASVVGTPVAGGILLGINGLKVGKVGGALVGLGMGLVLTYSLLGLWGVATRYAHPLVLLPVGAGIMWWVTGVLQGEVLAGHRKTGGRMVGVPAAIGVGLITGVALYFGVAPLLVRPVTRQEAQRQPTTQVVQPMELSMGEKQAVKYFPPVTEDEAKRVGQVLMAAGYFDKTGAQARDVIVGRERTDGPALGPLVVMFPMIPGKENEPEVLKGYAMVAQGFVRNGIRLPFVIRMVGPDGKVLKDIRADLSAGPTTAPAGQAGGVPTTTNPGPGAGLP